MNNINKLEALNLLYKDMMPEIQKMALEEAYNKIYDKHPNTIHIHHVTSLDVYTIYLYMSIIDQSHHKICGDQVEVGNIIDDSHLYPLKTLQKDIKINLTPVYNTSISLSLLPYNSSDVEDGYNFIDLTGFYNYNKYKNKSIAFNILNKNNDFEQYITQLEIIDIDVYMLLEVYKNERLLLYNTLT